MTPDGTVIAVGARLNDGVHGNESGHARVYRWDGANWTKIGQDIDGEMTGDQAGIDVSLSADGNTVAVAAYLNDNPGGVDAGHVRTHQLDEADMWTRIGQDIDGEGQFDWSGFSISLSADGCILAIGAWLNDGNGPDSGHVRIFEFNEGSWNKLGQDLDGEAGGDQSGISVALSADGNVVAIGANANDGNGENSGHVRVFRLVDRVWVQLGADIDGRSPGDEFGWSVALSADGTILAVGGKFRNNHAGHVRVFQMEEL
jgi:hypothetical protein